LINIAVISFDQGYIRDLVYVRYFLGIVVFFVSLPAGIVSRDIGIALYPGISCSIKTY